MDKQKVENYLNLIQINNLKNVLKISELSEESLKKIYSVQVNFIYQQILIEKQSILNGISNKGSQKLIESKGVLLIKDIINKYKDIIYYLKEIDPNKQDDKIQKKIEKECLDAVHFYVSHYVMKGYDRHLENDKIVNNIYSFFEIIDPKLECLEIRKELEKIHSDISKTNDLFFCFEFWKALNAHSKTPQIENFIEEIFQKIEQKILYTKPDKNDKEKQKILINIINTKWLNENDPLKLKALVYLGRLYYRGLLDQKNKLIDYEKAIEYWGKAEIKGDPQASYLLGLAYYSGKGVKQDIRKGKEYIEKAKNLGFKAASHALDNLSSSSSKKKILEEPDDYFDKKELKHAEQAKTFFGRLRLKIANHADAIITGIFVSTCVAGAIAGLIALTIFFPHVMVPIYIVTGVTLAAGGLFLAAFAKGGH